MWGNILYLRLYSLLAYVATFSTVNDEAVDFFQVVGAGFIGSLTQVQTEIINSKTTTQTTTEDQQSFGRASQAREYVNVSLSTGEIIRGLKRNEATSFFNIKYAKAPVGDLR